MNAKNITWYGKNRFSQDARRTGNVDVTIAKSVCSGQNKARLTFRNGVANLISETEYIQFGVAKYRNTSRVYFQTGTHNDGLKLSCAGKPESESRYVTINRTVDAEELIPLAGDYELLFDSECSLYYLQK